MADYAIQFDGVDDRVEATIPAWLTTFTIEALIKIDAIGQAKINHQLATAQGTIVFMYNYLGDGKISIWIEDAAGWGGFLIGTTVLSLDTWHHIVAWYDGVNMGLHLDDVSQGTAPKGAPNKYNQTVIVGGLATLPTKGLMNNFRLYNRTLTPTEITEHFNGVYTNETGLLLKLLFDNNVLDTSGNNISTIAYGNPTFIPLTAIYSMQYQSTPIQVPMTYDGQTLQSGQSADFTQPTTITISVPPEVTV